MQSFRLRFSQPIDNPLKTLKQIKSPWTEMLIAAMTRFMSDEDLYQDGMEENLLIEQLVSKTHKQITAANIAATHEEILHQQSKAKQEIDSLENKILCIPLHMRLKNGDIDQVIQTIYEFYRHS